MIWSYAKPSSATRCFQTGALGVTDWWVCRAVPRMTQIHPSKLEVTLIDHFQVSFGVEGGSISLFCGMVVVPNLPNLPPLAQWYRDGKTSRFSLNYGGFAATHSLFHP